MVDIDKQTRENKFYQINFINDDSAHTKKILNKIKNLDL